MRGDDHVSYVKFQDRTFMRALKSLRFSKMRNFLIKKSIFLHITNQNYLLPQQKGCISFYGDSGKDVM